MWTEIRSGSLKEKACSPAESVEAKLDVTTLRRGWKLEDRRAHLAEDQERQAYNQAAAAEGRPLKYILRTLYLPQQGMFCRLPAELKLGSQIPVILIVPNA